MFILLLCVFHTPCMACNVHTVANNSYLTVTGMHEMHGRMHPNYCQITILLVVDLCSSLPYFMMTQPLSIAGKLPLKNLVARQLPTSIIVLYTHAHIISITYT